MILVSQNREKVIWFGTAFNALEYSEQQDFKGRKEEIRHTICISDGCLEEVAQYETKERCLEVLNSFCNAYQDECQLTTYFDTQAQATIPVTLRQNTVFAFPIE